MELNGIGKKWMNDFVLLKDNYSVIFVYRFVYLINHIFWNTQQLIRKQTNKVIFNETTNYEIFVNKPFDFNNKHITWNTSEVYIL